MIAKELSENGIFDELSSHLAKWEAEFPDSVPELIQSLIRAGAEARASDLHLEPLPGRLQIRYRVDGCLVNGPALDGRLRANAVARVKVLAGLMTYRTDIPQEGRIPASAAAGSGGDLRVSIFPALHGERAVLRFPPRAADADGEETGGALEALGFPDDVLARLKELLERPHGLILLTGPAGSGKTTTLYACLRHLAARWEGRRHIVTIEDPVERVIAGVTQTQVNPAVELDYAAALRALLRQDPAAEHAACRHARRSAGASGSTGRRALSCGQRGFGRACAAPAAAVVRALPARDGKKRRAVCRC
jgi:general secretion pathway protein E